jgi:hypothetical protein
MKKPVPLLRSQERWYYKALRSKTGPVEALKRKIRSDQGQHPSLSPQLAQVLAQQHRQHPNWSYQLHFDNLAVLVAQNPQPGPMASYPSVRRYMKSHGLFKRPRRGPANSPGAQQAELRFEAREIRSYESEYVNGLWHLDFHHGSLRVLLSDGQWVYPILLGILFENTLPYSPYQHGQQEAFWGQIEGRLLPMLEGVADLRLAPLNEATQAWIELEYNRKVHSETGQTPLQRFLNDKNVGHPCPATERLQLAFTTEEQRLQRHSDGTLSLKAIRFEVPSRYGHLKELAVRYASWDLSTVHLADPKTGAILCRIYPQDKKKNAEGLRAARTPATSSPEPPAPAGMAPLLQKLIQQYATTGLPPAYLPQPQNPQNPS